MTITQAIVKYSNFLNEKNIDVPSLDVELLLCHVLKKPKEFLYSHSETPLTEKQEKTLETVVTKRGEQYPLAYILQEKEFFNRTFFVDERVLVPRPETELLVQEVLNFVQEKPLSIVDVGTGSGCVAITLAKELKKSEVTAIDISSEALEVAQQNAHTHKAAVTFIQNYLLEDRDEDFDVVVANLPYLPSPEAKNVPFEPQQALDGKEDGLFYFEELFSELSLKNPAAIFLEMGYNQGFPIQKLADTYLPDYSFEVISDYAGFPRVVTLKRK